MVGAGSASLTSSFTGSGTAITGAVSDFSSTITGGSGCD
jgi:hypothetical protein